MHRTPGGSSSGSGVSVSAGLAPVAIGTDTGGSVRLPAGWCGIVGLKVTAGRISTFGVLPLSFTLDTPGPLARSVEDAALIYRLLNGPDPRDRQTLAWAPDDPMPTLRRGAAGLRLAVMPDVERVGVDKEVLAAYDASVETLAKLGARIERVKLPHRFSDYAAATGRIIGAEGYRFVGHLVDDETQPVDPHVRPRIQIGRGVSARDYLLALAEREERSREVAAALADVDALLTPTALTPPIPIEQADQAGTAAHFTRPVNYLGLCGLAVPNGFTAGGLPTSLQIVAHAGGEAMALRIGQAYEEATDWKARRPPEPAPTRSGRADLRVAATFSRHQRDDAGHRQDGAERRRDHHHRERGAPERAAERRRRRGEPDRGDDAEPHHRQPLPRLRRDDRRADRRPRGRGRRSGRARAGARASRRARSRSSGSAAGRAITSASA